MLSELVIVPVLAHFRVEEILIDRSQLLFKSLIQLSDDLRLPFIWMNPPLFFQLRDGENLASLSGFGNQDSRGSAT